MGALYYAEFDLQEGGGALHLSDVQVRLAAQSFTGKHDLVCVWCRVFHVGYKCTV